MSFEGFALIAVSPALFPRNFMFMRSTKACAPAKIVVMLSGYFVASVVIYIVGVKGEGWPQIRSAVSALAGRATLLLLLLLLLVVVPRARCAVNNKATAADASAS